MQDLFDNTDANSEIQWIVVGENTGTVKFNFHCNNLGKPEDLIALMCTLPSLSKRVKNKYTGSRFSKT